MVKAKQKSRYRGAAIVEAAVVFPLIFLLTFGVIEYGWLFLKAQQITNASRQGARIAIRADATGQQVLNAISVLMTDAGMSDSGYSVIITPADISSLAVGDALEVRVTVPCENIAIINIPLLPKPVNLGAKVAMAKEGP
jgi:Flp pilus assembly protein TadG